MAVATKLKLMIITGTLHTYRKDKAGLQLSVAPCFLLHGQHMSCSVGVRGGAEQPHKPCKYTLMTHLRGLDRTLIRIVPAHSLSKCLAFLEMAPQVLEQASLSLAVTLAHACDGASCMKRASVKQNSLLHDPKTKYASDSNLASISQLGSRKQH